MTLLVLFALAALILSFLCSITEAVLLSITPSYVLALENQNRPAGRILSGFKMDVNRPLAAILSLNTVAHTVGAACVGAQAASVFGSAAVGIASGVLTILILVFSEIVPKNLGARYWRELGPSVAYSLVFLIWIMYPFVILSRAVTRIFAGGAPARTLSRDELKAMAELGEKAGLFRDLESSILRNIFRFPTLQVKDIMTPRTVLFALDANMTVEEAMRAHPEIPFSRIPIYLKTIDSIIGYVLRSDVLNSRTTGHEATALISLKRTIITVPPFQPLSSFFERLLDSREHIALVIDEYGGTAGIATMEDVVETLLGLEIVDEADKTEDMQALARAQWEKRARQLGLVRDES